MKYFYLATALLLLTSCTSIASVDWVQRPGGDNSSPTWVPECSNCHYVVNYKATQCPNPKDRSLIVWRDKDLFFEFPDNPQSDYKDEQLEQEIEEKDINSEEIITYVEDDDTSPSIPQKEKEKEKETNVGTATSDFEDLDWSEDSISIPENVDDSSSSTVEKDKKDPEKDATDTKTAVDTDFSDIDW